ncbi:hypothetical protein AAC387_Pa11g1426 [Persea americana]
MTILFLYKIFLKPKCPPPSSSQSPIARETSRKAPTAVPAAAHQTTSSRKGGTERRSRTPSPSLIQRPIIEIHSLLRSRADPKPSIQWSRSSNLATPARCLSSCSSSFNRPPDSSPPISSPSSALPIVKSPPLLHQPAAVPTFTESSKHSPALRCCSSSSSSPPTSRGGTSAHQWSSSIRIGCS